MRTWPPLHGAVEWIEQWAALDGLAARTAALARKVIPPGPVEDVLSGTPTGHPLHPPLVAIPIGVWSIVPVLDVAGERSAARRLAGLGCLAALPAATAGVNDWLSTEGAERRIGFVHALLNDAALSAYGYSWLARRRGRQAKGVAASLVGAACLVAAGYLGGHLVYAQGVAVDTTAYLQVPTDWTDVGAEADVPADGEVAQIVVDALPLLVARRDGRVVAMLDRCTHRGGPLSDGSVSGGCVVCPWHGSAFSLDDGTVRSGPATLPQAMFETRIRDGRVQVRRVEHRALRTNPVGS